MSQRDISLFERNDIFAALGLLTRLPVSVDTDWTTKRGAASAWAYPVAGIVIGGLAVIVGLLALAMGLPVGFVAAAMLAAQIIITGAMHEDGLADSCDGLWGGWDVERRLEIMKDSHIGVYGVLGLILSVLMRWALLVVLIPHTPWIAVIVVAAMSRAAMTCTMVRLPNARDGGLSSSVGRPSVQTAWVACAIAGVLGVIGLGTVVIAVIIMSAFSTILVQGLATAKIKGQTGDILGANQQVVEIVGLATLCAMWI